MKPKTPKHKTYTVHKKPAKKAEWKTIEEVLKETPVPSQLDRIERKLDELLARPYYQPAPVPLSEPSRPYPWSQTPHPPVDQYGVQVVYCSANGGMR